MAEPEGDITAKEAENAKTDEKEVDTKTPEGGAGKDTPKTPDKSGTPKQDGLAPPKAKSREKSASKAKKGGKG